MNLDDRPEDPYSFEVGDPVWHGDHPDVVMERGPVSLVYRLKRRGWWIPQSELRPRVVLPGMELPIDS